MDIDTFISKYQPEWRRLEAACSAGRRGLARASGPELEEIVALYLRVSAHLAEAQTHYRDERLRTYLNALVTRAHSSVYGARTPTARGALRLFGARYRRAIRDTAPYIMIAAGLLVAGIVATTVWVALSAAARGGLLPPVAREAAERAGARVDPFALSPGGLSVAILVNNVQVALLAFALGITLGVGTIYLVLRNAIFIGAIAGAFHASGNAGTFWTLVLPHGFLELTAISIAAGAGLRIGWALVDPGDRLRGTALAEEMRGALLVVLGVVPAFVLAALIEGFVTPSGLSGPFKVGLGAAVAAAYAVFLALPPARAPRRALTGDRTP